MTGARVPLIVLVWVAGSLSGAPAAVAPGADCPRFASGSKGLPTAWEWRTHPALADVNRDGRLDLAAHPRKGRGPRVWLGDGRGGWASSSSGLALPGMSCGVGVALADVNSDGHLDLGVADHCHGLFVFQGDGTGSWHLAEGGSLGDGRGYQDLQFGDLDADGNVDLIAVGAFDGGIAIHHGDGTGKWQQRSTGLPQAGFGREVELADINGDGLLDVAASFTDDRELSMALRNNVVWLSDGSGGYTRASEGIPSDEHYRGVALGDVDGDGRVDLALSAAGNRHGRRSLNVFRGDGRGRWKSASEGLPEAEPGLSFSGVALPDLDRDGHRDLVAITWLDSAIRVWRGDGTGRWEECSDTGLPRGRRDLRGYGLAVGDVNGDGRADLAAGFGRSGRGRLEVWVQQ